MAEGHGTPPPQAPANGAASTSTAPTTAPTKKSSNGVHETGPTSGATQTQTSAPPPSETYDVVVNGKTLKLTKEQLLARAQKHEAAEERMRLAKEAMRERDELVALLKEDPEAALAKLGHDPEKFLASHVERKAKEAAMSPEEKQRRDLEKQLEEKNAKLEAFEKEKREAAQQAMDERTWQQLETTLLTKASEYGLDRNATTLQLLAEVALEAIDYDYALTPDQICQEVIYRQKEHLRARDERLLKHMTPEQMLEYIGPERFEAMRQATLKKIPVPGKSKKPAAPPPPPRPEKGYISPAEFLKKYSK